MRNTGEEKATMETFSKEELHSYQNWLKSNQLSLIEHQEASRIVAEQIQSFEDTHVTNSAYRGKINNPLYYSATAEETAARNHQSNTLAKYVTQAIQGSNPITAKIRKSTLDRVRTNSEIDSRLSQYHSVRQHLYRQGETVFDNRTGKEVDPMLFEQYTNLFFEIKELARRGHDTVLPNYFYDEK